MNTPNLLSRLLSFPAIDRTRRNHGLEHATITLLSQKHRGLSLAGRSTPSGFYLYGEISTEAVSEAAHEALQRMKNGERHLAIHPNCGTNFVVAGLAAGLSAYFGFLGARNWRERAERLPLVAALATFSLIFAQPVGLTLQREVTTSGDVGEMEIVGIARSRIGNFTVHVVTTRG